MIAEAPVNVKLEKPTIELPNWEDEARQWEKLNRAANGNPAFYPLTIKGAYLIGVIYEICACVDLLLKATPVNSVRYLSAYGIFASGVEFLGRCLRGNEGTRGSSDDLEEGYLYMASAVFKNFENQTKESQLRTVLGSVINHGYTIPNLVALRHFAAHGQATSGKEKESEYYKFGNIDFEILAPLPSFMGKGLDKYWKKLQESEDMCNNLAKANVIAFRNAPIDESWTLFEPDATGKHHSIVEIFSRFSWQV
ncbi:MAG: hypothetical protein ISR58_13895 [Anaerolineales bacterium]|nr:hypothetical protein [Chloroflexota bacterium]MBL6982270.1 hypothetical protein [Anaerolineales bacterium]